jgi:hypothetical protein
MDFDGDGNIEEHRAPVTRLYPRRQRSDTKSFSQGDTKTFGVVVHPLNWLGLFYNRSNSFRPQSAEDINGNLVGNRQGDSGTTASACGCSTIASRVGLATRWKTQPVSRPRQQLYKLRTRSGARLGCQTGRL